MSFKQEENYPYGSLEMQEGMKKKKRGKYVSEFKWKLAIWKTTTIIKSCENIQTTIKIDG